jgi:hypothetical protein
VIKISRNDPALAHAMADSVLSRGCDAQTLRQKTIKSVTNPLVRSRHFFDATGGTVFERIDKEHGKRARWVVGGLYPQKDGISIHAVTFAKGEHEVDIIGVFSRHLVARIMQRGTGSDSLDAVLQVLRPCATVICSLVLGDVDIEAARLIKFGEVSTARLFVQSGAILADIVEGIFFAKTWIAADNAADPELRRNCVELSENEATIKLL